MNTKLLMLGQAGSMGHGLDGLQYSGNIIVWFGLNWSLDLYMQMNARLRRQGQAESVVPNQTMILPEYCSPSSPCPILPACPNINGQSPTFHRCLASSIVASVLQSVILTGRNFLNLSIILSASLMTKGRYNQLKPLPSTKERILALVKDMTLSMSAEDYNPLPDILVNDIWIDTF
jgi:hypothetical protein